MRARARLTDMYMYLGEQRESEENVWDFEAAASALTRAPLSRARSREVSLTHQHTGHAKREKMNCTQNCHGMRVRIVCDGAVT